MQIFYTPDISGLEYTFNEDESKHAVRVLRMNTGDTIHLVDGKGTFYEAIIIEPHPKRCKILVNNVITDFEKRNYHLHIAISPLKNTDRFEWFLEKATEIGIDEITPLVCEHTEKKNVNPERFNRILESAMKQSIKAYHPKLNPISNIYDFIETANSDVKMIACCSGVRKYIRECYNSNTSALILIGPEGDFSDEEIIFSRNHAFQPISLGNSRLRTETAGIAVCHTISLMNL